MIYLDIHMSQSDNPSFRKVLDPKLVNVLSKLGNDTMSRFKENNF